MTIGKQRISVDLLSILLLIILCWLFFWRLLTPNTLNQQSLVEGDFSGQFVAFAHYQAIRFGQGEVPLWNPYNYGGHPFLADTQSAVFYPPRLVTIAVLNATGGSTPQRMYDALQKEMIAHTLLASLLMYALVRHLTLDQSYSVVAGLVAGLSFAYSGYLTGYPQLQLAIMEAGIWLPLALLGIHEALRPEGVNWRWIGLSGLALGLSLMAGHPQTSLFFTYVTITYLAFRTASQRKSWRVFVAGMLMFGLIGAGLAAVQLIPGWEYTRLTVRTTLNFDAMGNGFPFYDVLQMLMPGILSLWSPLYIGVIALALAIYAVWRRVPDSLFWLVISLVGLGLSFGHGTIIYDIFYNVVPGFNLFRGQERSAYVITVALSILAGLGTAALLQSSETPSRGYKITLWFLTAFVGVIGVGLFFNWLITPGADSKRVGLVAFSLMIWVFAAVLITWNGNPRWQSVGIIGLIALDLFSFGRNSPNLETIPAGDRLKPSPLVQIMLADKKGIFRVDGTRLPGQNYGTLYGLMDIQGISPLRLLSVDRLLRLASGRVWEAFAVRYIPTENKELSVPSTVVAQQDNPPGDPILLHKLNDPRPFARLVYRTWIEPDDNAALGIFSDPNFDARHTVILPTDPGVALPQQPPENAQAQVTTFKPESITVRTNSVDPAILSLSLVYYPGWQATIDGQAATLLRADTAFTALAVRSGEHTVQLDFRPASYTVGALISVLTLILLVIGELFGFAISTSRLTFHRRNTAPIGRGP